MVVHTFLDSCLPSYDLDPGTSSCLCALNSWNGNWWSRGRLRVMPRSQLQEKM
jgi:hypothetical protein